MVVIVIDTGGGPGGDVGGPGNSFDGSGDGFSCDRNNGKQLLL